MVDNLFQMWYRLGIVLCVDIVVGQGIVPFLASHTGNGVTTGIADDLLGVVEPPTLHVGLGQPSLGPAVDGRLGGIETRHVVKRRSGSVEVTFIELRASHQHPGLPKKGIVFFPLQPLDVALRLFAAFVPHGSALDAVALYGFLAFLYRSVVAGFPQLTAAFVANSIERNQFSEVVFVAIFLFQRTVNIGQRTIVIGIVMGVEGLPPACAGGVLATGAACYDQDDGRQ